MYLLPCQILFQCEQCPRNALKTMKNQSNVEQRAERSDQCCLTWSNGNRNRWKLELDGLRNIHMRINGAIYARFTFR